jgi:hypothetical protein
MTESRSTSVSSMLIVLSYEDAWRLRVCLPSNEMSEDDLLKPLIDACYAE